MTLNRPDKLNAYIPAMGGEVVDAFARAREDAAVKVVILTGAGRAFCAGVDLDFLKAQMAAPNADGPRLGEDGATTSAESEKRGTQGRFDRFCIVPIVPASLFGLLFVLFRLMKTEDSRAQ